MDKTITVKLELTQGSVTDVQTFTGNDNLQQAKNYITTSALPQELVKNVTVSGKGYGSAYNLFYGLQNLETVDVTELDISNVTNVANMFYDCSKLTTIYCNNDWNQSQITTSYDMFFGCESLVGATTYSESNVGITMANPTTGYFTTKSVPFTGKKFVDRDGLAYYHQKMNAKLNGKANTNHTQEASTINYNVSGGFSGTQAEFNASVTNSLSDIVDTKLPTKQNTITDLDAIRNGANTALVTYGTTTYAEITALVNAKKEVYCWYGSYLYQLSGLVSSIYYFNSNANTSIRYIRVNASDTWSSGSGTAQTTGNMISSTSSTASSDSKYYSAKKVDNLISASEEVKISDTEPTSGKLWIDANSLSPQATEVVNSLEGSSTTMAPSVDAVNGAIKVTYSTSERVVGTWANGKPLYEKTINATFSGVLGAAGEQKDYYIPHGISNKDVAFVKEAVIYGTYRNYQLPMMAGGSNVSLCTFIPLINDTNIFLRIINDTWNGNDFKMYVTLRYTKTTD